MSSFQINLPMNKKLGILKTEQGKKRSKRIKHYLRHMNKD